MANFDFDNYSSLGIGIESFAMLEENVASGSGDYESEAEAEVKVSVDAGSDQQNDNVADAAADEVETVSDAGAELFKDFYRLASINETLRKHPLDQSLYAFLNSNNQLSRILNVSLPGTESMSKHDNDHAKETITRRINEMFSNNGLAKNNIDKFFAMLNNKLQKLKASMNDVVIDRRVRVSNLMFKMEDDTVDADSSSEEVNVETNSEDTADYEETSDAADESTPADANTAEECMSILRVLNVRGLDNSPMVQYLNSAVEGDSTSLEKIKDFTRKITRNMASFKAAGRKHRVIRYSKRELRSALEQYYDALQEWSTVNKMFFAMNNLTSDVRNSGMNGTDDFMRVLPKFQSMMLVKNYLISTKKIMDEVHYNLQLAATKLNKKYR